MVMNGSHFSAIRSSKTLSSALAVGLPPLGDPTLMLMHALVNRPKFLDQGMVEFSGLSQGSGLAALVGFISEIGTLLPIAPWVPKPL